jgi:hypothetical protein
MPGHTIAGIGCPKIVISSGGPSRNAPSRNAAYQSGTAGLVTVQSLYGPYTAIGLISTVAASARMTATVIPSAATVRSA